MKQRLVILGVLGLVMLGAACGRKAATNTTTTSGNTSVSTNTSVIFDTNDNLDQALQDLDQVGQ